MEELKWISVNQALPPIGKEVVTVNNEAPAKIGIGSILKYQEPGIKKQNSKNYQYPIWTSTNEVFSPSHWMILPESK